MRHLVNIGEIEQQENGYAVHVSGYDAEQGREFNDTFLYIEGFVRGKHMDPRKDPLSASCRLRIKTGIMEVVKTTCMDQA
ncbi:hypothetical protein [Priestia flexa]|uniref:hypothetical protein n=1 Tax=Priestia flexa TaxID=86664 RepID=UPI001C97B570|nr:hypothetical protein [Priestia flexa]MBY6087012.1 hypothetical protein [Priestia flexa]